MTVISPRVEKERVESSGKQSIVLLNSTDSKTYFSPPKIYTCVSAHFVFNICGTLHISAKRKKADSLLVAVSYFELQTFLIFCLY